MKKNIILIAAAGVLAGRLLIGLAEPPTPTTAPSANTQAVPANGKKLIWQSEVEGTQTIIILRHGEKPSPGLGQLTPRGLNRALALSKLIPERLGKPDYLFAPDPSERMMDAGFSYSYLRPLATIEPLAIRLQMSVRTNFGHTEIRALQDELLQANYANTKSVICWEHLAAEKLARSLLETFGIEGSVVPKWTDEDYSSVYVISITRKRGAPPKVTFERVDFQLGDLSDEMPEPARK